MKKLLRSLFSSSGSSGEDGSGPSAPREDAQSAGENERDDLVTSSQVLSELQEFVRDSLPDTFDGEEIDTGVNMFDAGYVNSITAAELLAHVESRYRVNIAESELIGRLDSLDALARHVASKLS